MARSIFVAGPSGGGKSTSMISLNPETTVIINTDKKDLPFKGWKNLYSEEKRNYREVTEHSELLETLDYANSIKKVLICVIDTWNREMIDYTYSKAFRSQADGRKAWMKFGLEQYELLHSIPTKYRTDLNIYLLCHIETVTNEYGVIMQRVAAPGNMITNLVPESFSSIVLYTEIQAIPGKRPSYFFSTISSGVNTCKTPIGMFDDVLIPNDLARVDKRIREYYA